MEEVLWASQQAILEALFDLPRSREEAVEEALVRMEETEYWPALEEHDPPARTLFYMLFTALIEEGGIEVRRARRGEVIEYGVTYKVAQNLEAWRRVKEL